MITSSKVEWSESSCSYGYSMMSAVVTREQVKAIISRFKVLVEQREDRWHYNREEKVLSFSTRFDCGHNHDCCGCLVGLGVMISPVFDYGGKREYYAVQKTNSYNV